MFLLVALVLLSIALCPAAPALPVAAVVVAAAASHLSAQRADVESDVPARFTRDTARICPAGSPKPRTRANAPTVLDARVVMLRGVAGALPIVSDLRIVGVIAAAGPGDLTVSAAV
jgi:hypothetical protein